MAVPAEKVRIAKSAIEELLHLELLVNASGGSEVKLGWLLDSLSVDTGMQAYRNACAHSHPQHHDCRMLACAVAGFYVTASSADKLQPSMSGAAMSCQRALSSALVIVGQQALA